MPSGRRRAIHLAALPAVLLPCLIIAAPTVAADPKTRRVSIDSAEMQANGESAGSSVSADGRYVAFESAARNLVAHDTNGAADVFVRDRWQGTIRRVSKSSAGDQGDRVSYAASISADGRYVAFHSGARNLVADDTNGSLDVFVRDRRQGTTRRVSKSSAGDQGNDHSFGPSISAGGRYVAFWSHASDLVSSDTNGAPDVFVRGPLR